MYFRGWQILMFKLQQAYSLQKVSKWIWVPCMAANFAWWRHHIESFSALLALFALNSTVTGEFPAQRPVTRSFDVFFDLRPNTRLSKQWGGWWFETPPRLLWRHCNGSQNCSWYIIYYIKTTSTTINITKKQCLSSLGWATAANDNVTNQILAV